MNAVISLCHFCEAHGPCAIFSTQTLRDLNIDELSYEVQTQNSPCTACNSIGFETGIISKDEESNASFVSTQNPILPEVANLVKQASVRSLSCEVSCNKDGGFVFFGDASRGHVFSHTFHISDVQARGFYQLFSIIILMKDKFYLLNIQPFLSDHLRKISRELQSYAQKIYDIEQAAGSIREQRMSGTQILAQNPRSLIELTGEKNIFPLIHSHFTWLLLAGTQCLTEHATFGNLPWLPTNSIEKQFVNIRSNNAENDVEKIKSNDRTENDELDESEQFYSLRYLKEILQDEFIGACYCTVVGIKIVIRGSQKDCSTTVKCLQKLLPQQMHKLTKFDSPQELTRSEFKIVAVAPEVAVPIPTSSIFRIDFLDSRPSVKWTGTTPTKLPDFLQKVLKAVDEPLLNNLVLDKRFTVLVEEWKNKIICLSRARSSSDSQKLKKILGVQPHDQSLVNYWIGHLS